jgi:hypothetical protein
MQVFLNSKDSSRLTLTRIADGMSAAGWVSFWGVRGFLSAPPASIFVPLGFEQMLYLHILIVQ